jgi:hypothetical protein
MTMVNTVVLQQAVSALYPYDYVESQSDDDDESRPSIYKLSDGPTPPSWMGGLSPRFERTAEKGILYRPKIVVNLLVEIERLFQVPLGAGLMVKGPQGVGKSHTLVNLVRNLEHQRRHGCSPYHVTFTPDCD